MSAFCGGFGQLFPHTLTVFRVLSVLILTGLFHKVPDRQPGALRKEVVFPWPRPAQALAEPSSALLAKKRPTLAALRLCSPANR